MFDGDGAEMLELQAYKIAENATMYKGSKPCPTCGIILNPSEYLFGDGICQKCRADRAEKRRKGRMA